MYWFTKTFSDISYDFFLTAYGSNFPSEIKSGEGIDFLRGVIVNIAIPIMNSDGTTHHAT